VQTDKLWTGGTQLAFRDLIVEPAITELGTKEYKLPVIFQETDTLERQFLQDVNNLPEFETLRIGTLTNVLQNTINKPFFELFTQAAPTELNAFVLNIVTQPITKAVYTQISNILLITTPGTTELNEVIQLWISYFVSRQESGVSETFSDTLP
jgi:hypothetical protein